MFTNGDTCAASFITKVPCTAGLTVNWEIYVDTTLTKDEQFKLIFAHLTEGVHQLGKEMQDLSDDTKVHLFLCLPLHIEIEVLSSFIRTQFGWEFTAKQKYVTWEFKESDPAYDLNKSKL